MSDGESSGELHIDADWKTEAAKEKERFAAEEKAAATGQRAAAGPDVGGPPAFLDLVNVLAMQAAITLGGVQGPGGERIPPNLQAAKHHIDLLDVLDQKTKGNLTEDEHRTLEQVLYELRMQYVQMVSPPAPQDPSSEPSKS